MRWGGGDYCRGARATAKGRSPLCGPASSKLFWLYFVRADRKVSRCRCRTAQGGHCRWRDLS